MGSFAARAARSAPRPGPSEYRPVAADLPVASAMKRGRLGVSERPPAGQRRDFMNPTTTAAAQEIESLEQELLEKSQRLAELKRSMPRERVRDYTLAGWDGPVALSSLFAGKKDLIVIHNMGKGCRYCTLWADGFNGI